MLYRAFCIIIELIYLFLHFNNLERDCPSNTRGVDNPLFCFMMQSSIKQLIECGSNDDHLPALTLAVTIYLKGLGHDIMFFPLFVSVSTKNNSIERMIKNFFTI